MRADEARALAKSNKKEIASAWFEANKEALFELIRKETLLNHHHVLLFNRGPFSGLFDLKETMDHFNAEMQALGYRTKFHIDTTDFEETMTITW